MDRSKLLPVVNSIWRVPLILAVTGLLSTLSVGFSLFDGTGRMQHWCARLWSDFIFFVSRVRVEVEGLENLDLRRGYVFYANHLSMFDHWAFLSHLPFQFRFAAKGSLFKIPFLGWHLKRSGNLPINYASPRQTLRSFKGVAGQIRSGISFVIYPEGMRTYDGMTVEFKRGAFLLAQHAQAPIVPVTIIGAHLRLRRGSIIIRPGRMQMIIHRAIEYQDYRQWDLRELADRVRSIVLERYRLEP